MTITT